MIVTLERVAVICLGMPQPKRYCALATSGRLYSKIVLLRSENATNVRCLIERLHAPPTPLHPIISVGPFAKWGIDFIICNPHSAGGHAYIILAVDYFTKWAEAMPTFEADGRTTAIFVFNHIIARFGVPQAIITDHGRHFRNVMMTELTDQLGLRHDSSTPYYPQANGLVESINKVLVVMVRRII